MKKWGLPVAVLLFATVLFGGCAPKTNAPPIGTDPIEPAPPNTVDEGAKTLKVGAYNLKFTDAGGVQITPDGSDTAVFYNDRPADIKTRGASAGLIGGFKESFYKCGYSEVKATDYGFFAAADITADGGSVFRLEDRYYVLGDTIGINRDIAVKAKGSETGYATTVSFIAGSDSTDVADYEYFIPAIIYKDTSDMAAGAILSSLDLDRAYVKETRTGLPIAMLRDKSTGYSLTLQHYKPNIVAGETGGGMSGAVNQDFGYGALGYTTTPKMSVDFVYPCSEGPTTYDAGQGWSRKYHEVKVGNVTSLQMAAHCDKQDDYNAAFVSAYNTAFALESPAVVDMDLDAVYDDNIYLFQQEYREYGTGNVKSAGVPWSLDLPDGTNSEGVSFQMGFVGQQIPVGAHLYRTGIADGDGATKKKGTTVLDFWAGMINNGSVFPTVWWDPADNQTAGARREYPAFLRCMVDGAEGLIEAYKLSYAAGEPQQAWLDAVKKIADNLTARQNDDGSFYRAYRIDGSVETGGDRNTKGTSKLNTPVAVRFLGKMYELTGDETYKTAALEAARFAYDEIYTKLGKYVGGTPDNPNTVDKEAAIYALYAFDAAYVLTGEQKYLTAAQHAAACAMSWTYCYEFSVEAENSLGDRQNPFRNGGTSGFSIIATGHSGADNFSSYMYYAMYRLYLHTDDAFYKDAALFLQNNTKQNTDYTGELGYKYRAMMPEATNIADLSFKGVGKWLPWSAIANIDPIKFMEDTFGTNDIKKLNTPSVAQKSALTAYGVGGKLRQN